MTRPILPSSSITEAAQQAIARFHPDTITRIEAAIGASPVVVVGMAGNPHVRRARRALETAGKPFEYLEFGSYFGGWKQRLAIKQWSGWTTFPQVFVGGKLVGGADELARAIEAGQV